LHGTIVFGDFLSVVGVRALTVSIAHSIDQRKMVVWQKLVSLKVVR